MHYDEIEDVHALISGYLDGELSVEERENVERRLAEDAAFREEFEKMQRLVSAAATMQVEEPPDEVWDDFLDGVYNRLERRTGWLLITIGVAALVVYGVYVFLTQPGLSALVKVLCATPVVGAAVLFISVLRQRLYVARTDRYSKEIKR